MLLGNLPKVSDKSGCKFQTFTTVHNIKTFLNIAKYINLNHTGLVSVFQIYDL